MYHGYAIPVSAEAHYLFWINFSDFILSDPHNVDVAYRTNEALVPHEGTVTFSPREMSVKKC